MSEQQGKEKVKQITKEPSSETKTPKKKKDPKKDESGRRLANHNKMASEALKIENQREKECWLTESSGTIALLVIGLALGAAYLKFGKRTEDYPPPPPPPPNTPEPQPSKIPVPATSIGME